MPIFPRLSFALRICLAALSTLAGQLPADQVIRILAANTSSGNGQSYDPGEGNRIFQGLDPDIALVQEMNYSGNTAANFRSWVDANFGTTFSYFREAGNGIPNGIVSRYPILASGEWDDTTLTDRDFVWAKIDIPGTKDLWAISVHLKASSGSAAQRNTQANALISFINANIPAADYVTIGGDFNTQSRSEACVTTLSSYFTTAAPYPVDQSGDPNTNSSRGNPYDWVLADTDLNARKTALVIGSNTFTNGLVFDSRVYTPLSEVAPVQAGDSGATGMQHMAVMRAFLIPTNNAPVITQGTSLAVTMSRNGSPTAFSASLSATDADSNPLTWSIQTAALHGTAGTPSPSTGTSTTLAYTPVTNYTGTDSFVVQVSDGQGGTDLITVNVTIQLPPNNAPVITQGTSISVSPSQNNYPTAFAATLGATDADGNPLTWSIQTAALHGTAGTPSPTTGASTSLSYTPANDYLGADSFVVQVSDGQGGTDLITVSITVQPVSALNAWTFDNFAPLLPGNQGTQWGRGADPDGDGRNNLEEFAMNTLPNTKDSPIPLLTPGIQNVSGVVRPTLIYRERMDGSSPALTYVLQQNPTLTGTWVTLPGSVYTTQTQTTAGVFRQTTILFNQSAAAIGAGFYRLQISQ